MNFAAETLSQYETEQKAQAALTSNCIKTGFKLFLTMMHSWAASSCVSDL